MTTSRLGSTTPILLSAILVLASMGGCAKDGAKLEALERSITDELAAIRQEILAAKLAPNDKVDIELQGDGPNTKIAAVDPPRRIPARTNRPTAAERSVGSCAARYPRAGT